MLHFYWASSLGLMVVRWFAGGGQEGGRVGENFLEDPSLPQRGNEKLAILNSLFIVPHDQLLVPGLAVNWTMQYCRSWFVFKSCLVTYDSSVCGLSGLGAVSRLVYASQLHIVSCAQLLETLNLDTLPVIGSFSTSFSRSIYSALEVVNFHYRVFWIKMALWTSE